MQVKNRTTRLAIGAALACGFALVVSAASAQEYRYPVGRGANDGGQVTATGAAPSAAMPRRRRNAPQAGYTYPTGRGVNDGGIVQVSATAPVRPMRMAAPQPSAPHYGRGVNDGGLVN